ncbi:hypothetical protein EYF80_039483 [Liparis tanakae]|uniref:Uncharacterized protein n=1 Tax=Liparis tanakae TaxID=230148 RepID=A0A4Z2G9S9_9TELE|nr:hypothetical protein EYF80_039483 [Liparis tanakae]
MSVAQGRGDAHKGLAPADPVIEFISLNKGGQVLQKAPTEPRLKRVRVSSDSLRGVSGHFLSEELVPALHTSLRVHCGTAKRKWEQQIEKLSAKPIKTIRQ